MKNRYFKNIFVLIFVISLSLFVISCASGPGDEEEEAADKGSIILAALETTGKVADGQESYTITAQVLDTSGKPLADQSVTFTASGNKGLVAINPPVTTTGEDGTATCDVTDISSEDDIVNISASSGELTSVGSIGLAFAGSAGGVEVKVGSVILAASETTGKVADGQESYTITAQVLDTSGKPLADQSVTFTASGNKGLVAINPPVTTTGEDGTATCDVTDISSEDDIVYISASSGGVNSVGSIGLAFTGSAGGAGVQVGAVILAAPETTGKVADGQESYTITAQVLDTSGKPLTEQSVTFTASGNSGLVAINPPVTTTGEDGTATCEVTDINPTEDTVIITASSGGVNSFGIGLAFTGSAGGAGIGSVILAALETTGKVANGEDSYTVTAQVLDTFNQPLTDQSVTFTASGNSGLVAINPPVTTTGEDGTATCEVTDINPTEDTVIITASSGGVNSFGIGLAFTGSAGGAGIGSVILAALETTGKVANGEDSYTVTAQVLDTFNQPLADQSVTFTASGNSGLVAINPPVTTTGEDGTATCEVSDISSTEDTVNISASSGGVNSVGSIGLAFTGSAGGAGVQVDRIILAALQTTGKLADGEDSYTITAQVIGTSGKPLADQSVTFTATGNTGLVSINPPVTTTGVDGTATCEVTDMSPDDDTFDISASSGGIISDPPIQLAFTGAAGGGGGSVVGSIELSAGSSIIVADGATGTVITASVKDNKGNTIADGVTITFTTTAGTLSSPTAQTTNGIATVTLTSPENVGSATITAASGGVNAFTTVEFIAGAPAIITVTAIPNNLSADGKSTSTIRADVRDAHDNAVKDGETISFSVTGSGTGTLSPPTAETTDGIATVTYTASTTSGGETIKAEATNPSVNDTTTITLIAASIGSVEVSAGSEVAAVASDTIITAVVKDTNDNNAPDGTSVSFTTTAGTLSSSTADTTNGIATVTLTGPQKVGSATITATAGGRSAYATVQFTAGPPDSITLTAIPNNLSADGNSTSTIRADVRDEYGNAVKDGETISFSVTDGKGTVSPPTAETTDGIATVTYTASKSSIDDDQITAETTNGVSESVGIELIATSIGSVEVSAGSEVVVVGLSTLITAVVKDTNDNNVPDGTSVSFTTTAGSLSSPTDDTTNGIATVTLTGPENVGSATITATAGGRSAYTTVEFIAGQPDSITVTAAPASLLADGESTSTIHADVRDQYGNAVKDGETISFSVETGTGTLSPPAAETTDGIATVTYTASAAPGAERIRAEATNGIYAETTLSLIGAQIASIELEAEPSSLPADGFSQSVINATLTMVGGGSAPDGTPVYFTKTEGGGEINPASPTYATTAGGVALAFLTSGTTSEVAKIRAEAGGRTAEIEVEYTPGSLTLTIIPNSLLGTGLETAEVTAVIKDAEGDFPPPGQLVTFTLDDMSLGDLNPASAPSDAQGEAKTTFQTSGKGGTVTVTATWNTGGINVTGSETIDMQPPPAFIEVADGSPNPASINIKGTGGQSTSQITFNVRDTLGNLVADGYRVDFTIDSGPNGGEDIIPPFDTTHDGKVTTILYSGFKSGPVSIKATYYHDTNISTTTSQIAINAGPPVGEEFGIFAEYLNISGFWKANLEDQISINAGDIYGNAIPDNTVISFKTYSTGGFFAPNTATTTDGLATSTLHSGGTYAQPLQGFVSVTGEAINGGRTTHVTSLAVTPHPDQHIIYAGTDGGGVYKSSDFGASWMNISRSSTIQGQNWINPYINDLSVDPDYPDTIYAATGYLGRGNIYRSLDGGLNWNSNNTEEWNGIFSADQAVLTVLCDDSGSDYVWIGTDGLGALYAPDGENFEWGGMTEPVFPTAEYFQGKYSNPTNTGNGYMTKPTLTCSSKTEDWTATYQKTGSVISTTPILSSADGADGTMTNVSSQTAETETWTVTYAGGYNNDVSGGGGNGTLTVISTSATTQTETWTITCIDGTDGSETFHVIGSKSGINAELTDISENYISDNQEVTFYITQTGNFNVGDAFTFTTDRDGWSVVGSVSGSMEPARTDIPYTSDANEVSFTINSGKNKFYSQGDYWEFETKITGNWVLSGSESTIQTKRANNNQAYSSDNNEVSFTIYEGLTPFAVGDTFTFHTTANGLDCGKVVRDIVKAQGTGDSATLYAATNTGVFKSTNGGRTWAETDQFTGDFINTLAIHPAVPSTIYAGTEDAGVWVSTDSGGSWTAYNNGMGKGLSATLPVPDRNNTGNGVINEVAVSENTKSEYWSLTCINTASNGGTFSVTGTVSGKQADAPVGSLYNSDDNEVSFTIADGNTDFVIGDTFTFSTTRDHGRTIKDILVDIDYDKLYAITYFWGPLEPHAVGNIYVHGLNSNGSMDTDPWAEANTNLPQYDPPDDTTLFAQHVMAPDIPGTPTALYIGGEGINLYKATDGIDTGAPEWYQSKSGFTNRIMARMPILFSGECPMDITWEVDGAAVNFTVYIQDSNGNPPVAGSTFSVELKRGEDTFKLIDVTYPDAYIYQGTWRDPADVTTNNPYEIAIIPITGDELTFTYKPICGSDAPGCSGSDQEETFTF